MAGARIMKKRKVKTAATIGTIPAWGKMPPRVEAQSRPMAPVASAASTPRT
jgi:hypothetical protein